MLPVPEIRKFCDLLYGNLKGNWKYLNHTSEYLISAGENYGSIMLAVHVNIEDNGQIKELKLVAKLCPSNDLLKEAFLTSITFIKEVKSYQDAHKLLKIFQMECNIPEKKRLDIFAKCYGTRINLTKNDIVDNDAVILLENLKIRGFTLEDRLIGMNFQVSEFVIKNMARLHATYIAIRLKKPNEFHKYIYPSLININNGGVMVKGFINTAIYFAKTIKECEPYLSKFIEMIESRICFNGLYFPVNTNENFYTIVHTDLWTNNIMLLKNNKGLPLQIKIIDLQLLNYGSPVRDLLFFLYTSVQPDICEKYFDYFINYYYKYFIECVRDFQCSLKQFSWDIFLKEVNDIAPHELFHIIFMLKPIFSERGSGENLDNLHIEDFERIDNMGTVYIQKLKQIILSFSKKNWI